jgi:Putative peptidoglycan-binding domain-containing protein
MILVKPNESSPRVAVIQILLNRSGNKLTVDGIFGHKMRDAVIDFQINNGITSANGQVGPSTWRQLPRGSNTEVVDVVDIGDPTVGGSAVSQLQSAGGEPIQLGLMCGGVEQMVGDVIDRSSGPGSIALLRITGHGNLGHWLTVSVGEVVHLKKDDPPYYREKQAEFHSYIDWDHFDALAHTLSRLREFFAPYGMMEHGGCSLGSVTNTRKLMIRLADLWAVPVSVGVGLQTSILNFDGRTFTAYPKHGTLASWTRPFREATY